MENLKEKFAKKMLNEKLDFLPLEESLQLVENGIYLETMFHYVIGKEELDEELEFNNTSPRKWSEAYREVFGNGGEIGNKYDHFHEFTQEICPAPTYIDLIK